MIAMGAGAISNALENRSSLCFRACCAICRGCRSAKVNSMQATSPTSIGWPPSSTVRCRPSGNARQPSICGNETIGSTEQATLNVKAAAPATLTGKLYIHGDSDVEFTSGSIASIGNGAELQLDGMQSRVSDGAGTANSALSGLASNYGTFDEEGDWSTGPGGSVVSLSGPFTNYNTFQLDVYNGDGASTFTDTGVFTNDDYVDIGNSYLSANTTMTVANLVNNGEVLLDSQSTGGAGEPLTTLNVNAAAPIAEGGFFRVIGNSLIHFASGGIQTISAGGQVELDGGAASIASGTGGANSALTGLTTNAGTFVLRGENGFGTGVTLSIAALSNTGTTLVDYYNGDGGTTLTIGGQLNNTGTLDIGNQYISAATSVSAASLLDSGALTLQGGTNGSTSPLATLTIASAASASVTGYMRVSGNATLSYGSGTGLTTIASTGWLELDATLSSIQIGASGAQNSALADLAINNGVFVLRGDEYGTGGVVLTISTAFTNNAKATAYIDAYGNGDGGTAFTVVGALHNYGVLVIGNQYLASSTVVQAASFTNSGHFTLQGAMSGSTSPSAKLEITAAAIAAVNGYIRIGGNATLSFGSGTGLTSITNGGSLELDGGFASVAIGVNGAENSGLDALSSNSGIFLLRGDQYGVGAPTVTTNGGFSNKGTLYLDGYGNGDGGSTLNIGGVLNNSDALDVGNQYLSATTLLTATSLVSTGSFTLQGTSAATGSGANVDISGAAAPTIVGDFRIGGNATLNYGSGTGFTTIAAGGELELDGGEASVSIGAGVQNSGVVNLVNNQGTFLVRGDSGYGTGGVTLAMTGGFTNSETVEIDYYGGDGGSTVSYNGTLTNQGGFTVGNSYEAAATTVTATNLSNLSGQLTVSGSSTIAGILSVSGVAYNYAGVTVNTGGDLAVSGAYIQYGGSTTVNGTLGAKTYTQNGGSTTVNGTIASTTVADHNGYVTYNDALTSTSQTTSLQLLNGAQLQFNAAVSASQTVTFQDATDVLYLTNASTFKGNVAGFVAGDTISLLGQAATSLAYSGGVLTVLDNSTTVASFHLTGGSYTTSSFNLVGDNNGGVGIFV